MTKEKLSKLFAGWDIAWTKSSGLSDFQKTKLKLTGYYLLIIFVLLNIFTFSLFAILQNESNKYQNNIDTYLNSKKAIFFDEGTSLTVVSMQAYDPTLNDDMKFMNFHLLFVQVIGRWLFLIEFLLLLLGGFLSYILASVSMRPIAQKNVEQEKFLADVSHELKNPLSALKMSLEISKNQRVWRSGEVYDVFADLEKEVKRLIGITNNILKLENKNVKQKLSKINIAESVKVVTQELRVFAEKKNIKIKLNLTDFIRIISAEDVHMIVYNILHNAIKFSKHNTKVEISLKSDGELSIKDYGIGIERLKLKSIFKRFYKVDNARVVNDDSGSGLGLSIVKELSEKNHLKIDVRSVKDIGTEFIVWF